MRQKRKSCDNKVVLGQEVNAKLENPFSTGVCFVGASQSMKTVGRGNTDLRSRGTGERRVMLKSNISSCGK